jgi:cytochrome b involved in lipid metabolism
MNEYTLEEVIENNFIIIDDKVYDFKEFEKTHPGGSKVLIKFRGENATEKFYKVEKHGPNVKEALVKYQVGILV